MKVSFSHLGLWFACFTHLSDISSFGVLGAPVNEPTVAATVKAPNAWKPKVTNVSVFKNGLGFFTREGDARLDDGWVHTAELPPAAFGTLAIYPRDPNQMVDLVGVGLGEITAVNSAEAATYRRNNPTSSDALPQALVDAQESLSPLVGSLLEIAFLKGLRSQTLSGKLLSVNDGFAVIQPTTNLSAVSAESDQGSQSAHFGATEGFDSQPLAISLESVFSFRRLKSPTRIRVIDSSGQGVTESKLHMVYLRKGILWLPEYTLKILDDQTAELTLRGTLINEAEDIIDADVNFVVGVPHFVHSDLMAPLAIGHALRAIGTAIPPNSVPSQVMSQVMNRAMLLNNSNGFRNSMSSPDQTSSATQGLPAMESGDSPFADLLASLPQQGSAGSGDYSVYTKKNVTVRKGERASVTLMTTKIRYSHRYEWIDQSEVRHLLSLENSTALPWTTGPCLTLSEGKPLSEDILKYTPARGRGELTVTTAVNTFQSVKESEIDRQLNAHSPSSGQNFDLVKLQGTIKLLSHEKQPISIRVRRAISGKPLQASHNGVSNLDSEYLRLVDRRGTVEWNLTLKPNEEVVLDYVYERYVSSN